MENFLCPDYYSQVEIGNAAAWYNNCKNAVSKCLCKVKASEKMVVVDGDLIRCNISVAHIWIANLLTVTVSNNSTREVSKNSSIKHSNFLLKITTGAI